MYRCALIITAAVLVPSVLRAADVNWAGTYAGINAGFGWSSADWRNKTSAPPTAFFDYMPGQGFSDGLAGVFGGAQIGVNFQNGPWVYGFEASIAGSGIEGNFASTVPSSARDDQFKARLDALLLLTGRAGYAWSNMLAYAKAGYAVARIHLSVSDTNPPTIGSGSDTQWHSGPTIGAGLEYALTPQLSLATEYNHVWLGSGTYQLGGGAGNYSWTVGIRDINLFMAKLNYRFAAR